MAKKFKIKKGDTVQVIAGKDKGKQGTVLENWRSFMEKIMLQLSELILM